MIPKPITEIIAALAQRNLRIEGQVPDIACAISRDASTVGSGELFIAIDWMHFRGHEFVLDVLQHGACGAIVESGDPPFHKFLLKVDSTLHALQDLARSHLKSSSALTIALTGSCGKTTTKEMIRSALTNVLGEESVFASDANENSPMGMPLQALRTNPKHKVHIFEMGTNSFGGIRTLVEIAPPSIALITNIGLAHTEFFIDRQGVAKAKAEIYERLGPEGIAVYFSDDDLSSSLVDNLTSRKLSFGTKALAQVRLMKAEQDISAGNQRITLTYEGKQETATINFLGLHNALNASGAIAVALASGSDFAKALHGLEQCSPLPGRLAIHNLPRGITLIDDSYNANPQSMEAGLRVLASFSSRRRIACLGGMAELGARSHEDHRMLGRACAELSLAHLYTCGEDGCHIHESAYEAGMKKNELTHAATRVELAALVPSYLRPEDVIFVKGSNSSGMKEVVEKILQQYSG